VKNDKTEVTIGTFGRLVFEAMTANDEVGEHWQSIAEEARPLVERLLMLNDKMEGGGYSIVGHKINGKKVKPKLQRIREAKKHDLLVPAGELEEGDRFWLFENYDHGEMHIGVDDPLVVDEKTKKGVYFDMSHCGGHHTEKIDLDEKVLKAPNELSSAYQAAQEAGGSFAAGKGCTHEQYLSLRQEMENMQDQFTSDDYWLRRADELGI